MTLGSPFPAFAHFTHSVIDSRADRANILTTSPAFVDIERELDVPTPPLISISPLQPLWDACELLIRTHARRLPLLDIQPTGEEVVLSVLTQYRALKAISTNVSAKHVARHPISLRFP